MAFQFVTTTAVCHTISDSKVTKSDGVTTGTACHLSDANTDAQSTSGSDDTSAVHSYLYTEYDGRCVSAADQSSLTTATNENKNNLAQCKNACDGDFGCTAYNFISSTQ